MPFASNFGYDTTENFNYCLETIFQGKAAEIFSPIYSVLGGFTDIISLIVNVTLGVRKLFSNFLFGVNNFVRGVRDKIQSLLFSIRMSFVKLKNLMGRVYGTMYAVIFMGTSAMTAGLNIADNDLVKFLFEFCFHPHTKVVLHNGDVKPIKDILIGDRLQDVEGAPVYVTSTFLFDGSKTNMVQIDNIIVSGEHFVKYKGKMISAKEHPSANSADSIPELICLNVTGNKIKLGENIYADYDETSNPEVVNIVQNIALKALNGFVKKSSTVENYSLGLDGDIPIQMADDTFVMLKEIQIGMSVKYSGKVCGIVKELCNASTIIDGYHFASAQLLFDSQEKLWKRAGTMNFSNSSESVALYHIITETCGSIAVRLPSGILYTRDYREVALPEMEEPYYDAQCKN